MISKKNLFSLLKTHGNSLNEALSPLMAEVGAIMISQPLAVELPSDGNILNPISLSTLLTMKNRAGMPPPEEFGRTDKREEKRAGKESNIFLKRYGPYGRKNIW